MRPNPDLEIVDLLRRVARGEARAAPDPANPTRGPLGACPPGGCWGFCAEGHRVGLRRRADGTWRLARAVTPDGRALPLDDAANDLLALVLGARDEWAALWRAIGAVGRGPSPDRPPPRHSPPR